MFIYIHTQTHTRMLRWKKITLTSKARVLRNRHRKLSILTLNREVLPGLAYTAN